MLWAAWNANTCRSEAVGGDQAVIVLPAKADFEQEVARLDGILHIECNLVDVVGCVECEHLSAARQIERNQSQRHIRIGDESGVGTVRRIRQGRRARWVPVTVETDRVERRVGKAEAEILQ